MEKSLLDKFIKKYNLNGNVEAVRWSVNASEKTLSVSAKSENENTIVYVTMNDFDAISSDVEFGVFETKRLKQLLTVFDDKVDINVNMKNGEVRSLDFVNDRTQVQFVAASLEVVSTAPQAKGLPTFNVEIAIDERFIEDFCRAKAALPSADIFTLINNKDGDLKLILGYSSNSTDRITLSVNAKDGKNTLKVPLHFESRILKEILSANDEIKQAVLNVSDRGLAHIEINGDNYKSSYYMVAFKDID